VVDDTNWNSKVCARRRVVGSQRRGGHRKQTLTGDLPAASAAAGAVTLYAVRKGGTTATGGGEIVSLVDNSGYNATLTGTPALVATAAANTRVAGTNPCSAGRAGLVRDRQRPRRAQEVGADFSYTLTVSNGGNRRCYGGWMCSSHCPPGVAYSSAAGAGFGVSEASGLVTFTGGSVAAGSSSTLTVYRFACRPRHLHPARLGGGGGPAGNRLRRRTRAITSHRSRSPHSLSLVPDLTVNLGGPSLAVKDVPFDYTLAVANGGLGDASGVNVQFHPAGRGGPFHRVAGAGFTVSEDAGVVTFFRRHSQWPERPRP